MSNRKGIDKLTYKEWRERRLSDRSVDHDTPDYKIELELVKEYEKYLNGESDNE